MGEVRFSSLHKLSPRQGKELLSKAEEFAKLRRQLREINNNLPLYLPPAEVGGFLMNIIGG